MKFFSRKANGKTYLEKDSTLLGKLAVERGYVSREDVETALKVQSTRPKLGEVLVREGKLTIVQLNELLVEQAILRGDETDSEVLRQYERRQFRRGLTQIRSVFAEARAHSQNFTAELVSMQAVGVDIE